MPNFLAFFEVPKSGWRLRRDDFVEHLLRDWPDARLVPGGEMGQDDMRDVGWTYGSGEDAVECWSAQKGDGISMDGDEKAVAPFVAWFRGLVPDDVDVIFCDDMYSFSLVIPRGVSSDGVRRMYAESD